METMVLKSGHTSGEFEQASPVMAEYVRAFCGAALEDLREHREFLDCCMPASAPDATAYDAREADMDDVTRVIRRVTRVQRRPLPHAQAELRRLLILLDRVPLDRLEIAPDHVTLSHRPSGPPSESDGNAPFDICLPPPGSRHFPIFVRKIMDGGEDVLFIETGRHGACRGEAVPMIETAVERVALSDLALIALSWARRNV
jgi:hypothetical protein